MTSTNNDFYVSVELSHYQSLLIPYNLLASFINKKNDIFLVETNYKDEIVGIAPLIPEDEEKRLTLFPKTVVDAKRFMNLIDSQNAYEET